MIEVNVQGVQQAIQTINNAVNQTKIDQFLNQLALVGTEEARASYGTGKALVWYELTQNKATIYAGGDAIGFLEFGAGAATTPNEFAQQVPYRVEKGSWSDEHEGEYQATGYEYWHLGSVKFTAVEPKRGMYNAKQKILAEIHNIAKGIFK